MKKRLIFLQILFIASLLFSVAHGDVALPTEKAPSSGFEHYKSDPLKQAPEVQNFFILKTSQTVNSQEYHAFDAGYVLSPDYFVQHLSVVFSENFFFTLSDKRHFTFRYLFPFHSFW